jgi:prevent-host-death family protein
MSDYKRGTVPEIGVRDLETRASEIVEEVRQRRGRYIVTHEGRPVGMLVPLDEQASGEWVTPDPDGARIEDPWTELERLGDEIGRGWGSFQLPVELLSKMRH